MKVGTIVKDNVLIQKSERDTSLDYMRTDASIFLAGNVFVLNGIMLYITGKRIKF